MSASRVPTAAAASPRLTEDDPSGFPQPPATGV